MSINRIFNKEFYTCMYWGEFDSNGNGVNSSLDDKINLIKDSMKHNVDGLSICIHIRADKNTNNFVIAEDLNKIQDGINEALKLKIPVKCIKVHMSDVWDGEYFQSITFKNLFFNMLQALIVIANKFAGQVPKMTIFNESPLLYRTMYWHENSPQYVDYTPYVVSCINTIKNKGYEVGICTLGVDDASKVPSGVFDALDFLGVNWYPNVFADLTTSESDFLSQLRSLYNSDLLWFRYFKENYPNKKLYITETGVLDYEWQCLANSVPTLEGGTEYCIENNGVMQNKMLIALFNIFNDVPVDGIWHWWFLKYDITAKTCAYYLGRRDYNE